MRQPVALLVNGTLSDSRSEKIIEVIDPSVGQPCLSIPLGCDDDVDYAVDSSRRAFESGCWSEASPLSRKRTLHRFADLIATHGPVLDALDAGEMGKPVSEIRSNAAAAANFLRFYAEAVDKVTGDVLSSDARTFAVQRRIPRGVVAAVTPWNFPTHNAVRKFAPALAAGNCVVVKPSELSSRSAIRLAQLAMEAGLPPGVLNVVPGAGVTVGRALALHTGVDMLTFTGSTSVGKLMVQYAARSNLKPVIAECGGKSPHIVFDDGIDLDAAACSIADSLLANQGQICSVGSRLLVQSSVEFYVLDKIKDRMSRIVMGNALDPRTTFGPLASGGQFRRVMQHIENAKAEGIELAAGGRRALEKSGGYFVEPTVFRNVSPHAAIAQEEIFGPVLAVTSIENEDEAVHIANGTAYGLAAYVWTANLSRGLRIAKRIRSSVWTNAAAPKGEGAGQALSLEPTGQSGIGTEGGLAGMESYLRRQTVTFNHD